MRNLVLLAGAALFAAGTGALAGSAAPGTVSGTVDQSEWAEPGQLTVNLETGAYSFEPGVSTREGQSARQAMRGTLPSETLGRLNALANNVGSQGLVDMQCASIDRSERANIVVSNGGRHQITVALDGAKQSSHPDLECWTAGAKELHRGLQAAIDAERARQS